MYSLLKVFATKNLQMSEMENLLLRCIWGTIVLARVVYEVFFPVVVENVRIYHDLGYIFGIGEYLQHIILECLRRRANATDAFAPAYYCLQVSTTY